MMCQFCACTKVIMGMMIILFLMLLLIKGLP
jgi:hypothetical protein